MTEEEAKTKWCPFVRLTATEQEWHVNRDPSLPSSPGDTQAYRCIASACMAWRPTEAVLRPDPTPVGDAPTWAQTGYCGLAGAPQ